MAQRRPATFFPCRLRRHSSRINKVPCRRPPRCFGLHAGAPPVVSGLTMAIEATMVAARYKPGDRTMIIGSFKKVGEGYEGEIVTLTQKIRGVRFVPEANRASDNVPNFRVQMGKLEAGAAWVKHTTDWREYLSVKLDDPTLPGPIFASLFEEEGGAYNLVWSRQRPRNGD